MSIKSCFTELSTLVPSNKLKKTMNKNTKKKPKACIEEINKEVWDS